MVKKSIVWIILLGVIILTGIIVFSGIKSNERADSGGSRIDPGNNAGSLERPDSELEVKWMEIILEDVKSGEKFKISDYRGKFVLLESFAVWCPTCTRQQELIQEFHDDVGDSVVTISLNTDSSEDADKVIEHIERNNFQGIYVLSPIEMTQTLIEEFGTSIVSAPSVPIVLICEDGNYRKLGGFGVRNVEELKSEIEAGC